MRVQALSANGDVRPLPFHQRIRAVGQVQVIDTQRDGSVGIHPEIEPSPERVERLRMVEIGRLSLEAVGGIAAVHMFGVEQVPTVVAPIRAEGIDVHRYLFVGHYLKGRPPARLLRRIGIHLRLHQHIVVADRLVERHRHNARPGPIPRSPIRLEAVVAQAQPGSLRLETRRDLQIQPRIEGRPRRPRRVASGDEHARAWRCEHRFDRQIGEADSVFGHLSAVSPLAGSHIQNANRIHRHTGNRHGRT